MFFPSQQNNIKNSLTLPIMIHIWPSTQQTLLITLHVSALMGHLQVFPFIHYQLTELQRGLHTFSFTYICHTWLHSFSRPPYMGISTSVGLLHQSVSKLKLQTHIQCLLVSMVLLHVSAYEAIIRQWTLTSIRKLLIRVLYEFIYYNITITNVSDYLHS
jgi:hypothetical protein